ncbi:Mss4-like protein [Durotheca rogersii]|uniref:Mss4-like protein n=1 Tax=Durotheca rogersii TaxID=419775 RepID=UPI00221EE4A0|nr:Mss4-like protein [Durotheca rogersii]KAI5863853.1 Mss4-like protein [Durotheca rogersii]
MTAGAPADGNGGDRTLTVQCQCGSVSFPTPAAAPVTTFFCHCTDCQRQSSSAFGTSAIFPAAGLFPLAPELAARMRVYHRPSQNGRTMDCYFCPNCGSRLMHRIFGADGTPRPSVAIKGGCIDGLDWGAVRMHIFTRSAVVKLPDDAEKYEALPPWMKMD